MDYDWGSWIEHDGLGCPDAVIGKYIQAVLMLSSDDEDGGGPCFTRDVEGFCDASERDNPNWSKCFFGQVFTYTSGPNVGRDFKVGLVLSYRIRKPRVAEWLNEMTEDLPAPEREEELV